MNNFDVHIYTDGSSRGNPGPGGYGIVMEWVGKPYKKEFSEGFKRTTNNRMELLAVIEALKKLKKPNLNILVFTDSKYVADAVEKKWVFGWEKKGFKDKKNPDLWIDFLKEYRKHHVRFQWIKGHNNHSQNERCDFLAVEASKKENLLTDHGFENQQTLL
ncbi:ribonuclease HI [Zhouia amylolytica]|uniref:ribonuclease H n=1 Tax=Zhouia amylolytica AD3 TaxID=1286632 RepID=W2UMM7_9FLAO|nr:ribonuclease HI [Zhouia amylolytica]ETN94721.1 ribonuclease HI [Zhouia amylolytica AD3]MCQ0110903.1 ribonuclease HI [Zhouia amylolytica]